MTVSQSPVVLLSVLLVGCTRSIERTEPKPLYPVHGAVVDSINGLPLPHARVGVAHGGSRTCRLPSDSSGTLPDLCRSYWVYRAGRIGGATRGFRSNS